ncbi:MAG TPA: hypothetical protein VE570_00760 [Thermoleophilaceae bacterium]|nr:hypothetical protein [Thermoleophilaceae bacterium]
MNARSAAAAAATAATLLLAACGGSNGDDPTAGASDDAKRYAFAECLRKAGIQVNGEPGSKSFDIRVPDGISKTRMAQIDRECRRKSGLRARGRDLSPQERARFLDQALKFARCMRAHGVPMTDPKADAHGITMGIDKGSGGDVQSPAFRRAEEACRSLNPKAALGGKK